MTTRLAGLLGILAVSVVLLVSTKISAADVEITNDTVGTPHPCYNKATTKVLDFRGITTWCDVRNGTPANPGVVYCTSTGEPVWCENGDSK